MNQRISRNKDRKNNLDFISVNAGGNIARHTPNEEPQVQVPQKATGDIKPEQPQPGVAKASPNFKEIAPNVKKPASKAEEKKTIAENTIPVEDGKSEETDV